MKNLGLLVLRLTVGTLMAGHGAQKLFGWFEGPGLKGTRGFVEMLGMKPGHVWGPMAALGEFSGGVLTALGLLNPMGPLNIVSAMVVASRKAHWDKPIWASKGGAELPVTNMAAALCIALAGPGDYSMDRMLGIKLPGWMVAMMYVGMGGITYAALQRPEVAESVLNTVKSRMGQNSAPAEPAPAQQESDLEVENRPTTQPAMEKVAGV